MADKRSPRKDPRRDNRRDPREDLDNWKPKTEMGMKVKNKEITEIDEILDKGHRILEPEIVDTLLNVESDLILIGQSKGKFGGGQRRAFRQTQKKTMEGNKPTFAAYAVVGNKDGFIGVGHGRSKETVPAREKAVRNAKLHLFKIRRGSGSWEDAAAEPHSIPFAVEGKCGSVVVKLMPAPKGKGLVVDREVAKILEMAGIKNCWAKTRGQAKNKVNVIKATEAALRQLARMKIKHDQMEKFAIVEGAERKTTSGKDEEAAAAAETAEEPKEGEQA